MTYTDNRTYELADYDDFWCDNFDEYRSKYFRICGLYKILDTDKYQDTYVFDEDKTVRWNKEKVKEENDKEKERINDSIKNMLAALDKSAESMFDEFKWKFEDKYKIAGTMSFDQFKSFLVSFMKNNDRTNYGFEDAIANMNSIIFLDEEK